MNTTYAPVRKEMDKWRSQGGMGRVPQAYIEYHQKLAEAALESLKGAGVKVHNQYLQDDGWLDGMKVLFAVIELKDNELVKIHWHDSHDHGNWMQKLKCGSAHWELKREMV
ncbi:MAG: hypothetical protein ACREGB_00670 [Candidatus Saccharimonadales bacterium]